MGNQLAASRRISAADRRFMFRLCGVGDWTANQKNRETVHCGYHKTTAVTHGMPFIDRVAFCTPTLTSAYDLRAAF